MQVPLGGRRVAVLMAKLHRRIFNVATLARSPSVVPAQPLAQAFKLIDQELDKLVANGQLSTSQT